MSPGPVRSGPGPLGPRRSPPPASEAWRWHSAREGPGSRGRAEGGRSVTGLGSRCQPGHPVRPDLASWTRSRAVVPPACGACSCSSAWSLGFCLAPPGPPLICCCSEPFLAFLPRTRPHFSGFHCQMRTRSMSWHHLQSEGHFRPGPWLRRRRVGAGVRCGEETLPADGGPECARACGAGRAPLPWQCVFC